MSQTELIKELEKLVKLCQLEGKNSKATVKASLENLLINLKEDNK